MTERDDRTLFGMKKIDIKWNNTNDQSLINQPFVYRLFRKYNAFSPHSTLGTFTFDNGSTIVNMGIMTVNEPIDKTFMRRYLTKKNAAGDLYKALYNSQGMADLTPNNAFYESNGEYFINPNGVGVEDTFNYYHPKYDLKTNEDESTHTALLNLLVTLNTNQYASADVMKDELEAAVDMDAFLRYAALSYLTGNEDDLRNNGNNYYIYFSPASSQAYFIPYDYDWSLGVGYDGNGGQAMATISPYHSKMQGSNRDWQHNPLYWYTIIDNQESDNSSKYHLISEYQNQYAAYVKSFANSEYFSLEAFNKLYQAYYRNYSSFSSDVESNSTFNGVDTFVNYYNAMMTTIANYID
ncbi:MAG TPA: CotH kinase family protein [Bacilli bacterium]|nr:CotH kinase family protein [Bacilli bacterium]